MFLSRHKVIGILSDSTLTSESKLSQYEVTETVANHIFTEGGFQKKEVLMMQSVMFIFCTSFKTHKKQRSCKSQNLPQFDNKPSTHHVCRVWPRRQTIHNKKFKMHGLGTSGYLTISALRGVWPMHPSPLCDAGERQIHNRLGFSSKQIRSTRLTRSK